jgi:hypothetical protein
VREFKVQYPGKGFLNRVTKELSGAGDKPSLLEGVFQIHDVQGYINKGGVPLYKGQSSFLSPNSLTRVGDKAVAIFSHCEGTNTYIRESKFTAPISQLPITRTLSLLQNGTMV